MTRPGPGRPGLVRWSGVTWQAAHLGLGGMCMVGLWVVLARTWGPAQFGRFTWLVAFASTWAIVFDLGLDVVITRLVASGAAGAPRRLLPVKAAAVVLGLAGALGLGSWLTPGSLDVLTLLLAGMVLFSCANFVNGYLRGIERLDVEARIGLLQKVLFAGAAGAGALWLEADMRWMAGAYLGSQALALCLTLYCGLRLGFDLDADSHGRFRQRLTESLRLWGVALLTFLALRLDLLLLQRLGGDVAAGQYAAAFRMIEGFTLLGTAFVTGLFPRLAASVASTGDTGDLLRRASWLTSLAGLAAGAGLFLAAPRLMPALYGPGYKASVLALQGLGLVLPVLYLGQVLTQAHLARVRPGVVVLCLAAALAVDAAVAAAAIPVLHVFGAVVSFAAREAVLAVLLAAALWAGRRTA